MTSAQKAFELKEKLLELPILTKSNVTLEQLQYLLQEGKEDLIITINPSPRYVPRRLQSPNDTNNTVESKIFENITPYSLSGLWVGLFLIVVLLIGINCMLDLKTNDRFARQNLWVGRESWSINYEFIRVDHHVQNSKVEGSGLGTFKLFLKRNSARVSTGSLGKVLSSSTMPYERMGTKLASRYFLKAKDVLSRIYLSSFCSFFFFMS